MLKGSIFVIGAIIQGIRMATVQSTTEQENAQMTDPIFKMIELAGGAALIIFTSWNSILLSQIKKLREDMEGRTVKLREENVRLRQDLSDHLVDNERRLTKLEEHDKYGTD